MRKPKTNKDKIETNSFEITDNRLNINKDQTAIAILQKEIEVLSKNQANFKEELEKNKEFYEQIIDEAADKIENFTQKTNSDNQIQ